MKRLGFIKMVQWDIEHDSSIVRELEMHVDVVLTQSAYSPQFWKDVRLYGVAEAMLYLKNQRPSVCLDSQSEQMKELEAFVIVITKLILG